MVDFGNILKTLRLREDMTQAQLARKLGLTKSVISAYETGLRLPSYDILIHIAKIYGVSTDYLLGLEHKQEIDLSGLSQEEIDNRVSRTLAILEPTLVITLSLVVGVILLSVMLPLMGIMSSL